MPRENQLVQLVFLLHDQLVLAARVVRRELRRAPDVALRERAHLRELAVLVAISLRRAHVAAALDHQAPDGRAREGVAVHDPARDDEVITLPEREGAKLRVQNAGSVADVHDLVALRVAVEELVLAIRLHEEHRDVGVEEQRHTVQGDAAARRELVGAEVTVAELPVGVRLPVQIPHAPDGLDVRRLVHVIEQRGRALEPLVADQLLGVERAVRPAEDDVAFARDLA